MLSEICIRGLCLERRVYHAFRTCAYVVPSCSITDFMNMRYFKERSTCIPKSCNDLLMLIELVRHDTIYFFQRICEDGPKRNTKELAALTILLKGLGWRWMLYTSGRIAFHYQTLMD